MIRNSKSVAMLYHFGIQFKALLRIIKLSTYLFSNVIIKPILASKDIGA